MAFTLLYLSDWFSIGRRSSESTWSAIARFLTWLRSTWGVPALGTLRPLSEGFEHYTPSPNSAAVHAQQGLSADPRCKTSTFFPCSHASFSVSPHIFTTASGMDGIPAVNAMEGWRSRVQVSFAPVPNSPASTASLAIADSTASYLRCFDLVLHRGQPFSQASTDRGSEDRRTAYHDGQW